MLCHLCNVWMYQSIHVATPLRKGMVMFKVDHVESGFYYWSGYLDVVIKMMIVLFGQSGGSKLLTYTFSIYGYEILTWDILRQLC